jgi:hypothetical protein
MKDRVLQGRGDVLWILILSRVKSGHSAMVVEPFSYWCDLAYNTDFTAVIRFSSMVSLGYWQKIPP